MIDLVTESAGQQTFTAHLERFTLYVLRSNRYVSRTQNRAAKSGQGKASFLFPLVAFDVNDLRIREHQLRFRIFSHAHVNDRQLFR